MEEKENLHTNETKKASFGRRLRNLSGDLLKKTTGSVDRSRNFSGDVVMLQHKKKQRHPSGEHTWDLTGERIRNVSGESCGSRSSPLPLSKGSKIMIALDNSKSCEDTIHYYLRHVHRPENDVVLAHVIELPDNAQEAMKTMLSRETIQEMWTEGVQKAEKIERHYATILQQAGVDHVHIRNESGLKPGQALCQVAEQEDVDMIIVGSRGEGLLRRTLMGSVSDYIVHHASVPALVCPPVSKKHRHASAGSHSGASNKPEPMSERQAKTPSVNYDVPGTTE